MPRKRNSRLSAPKLPLADVNKERHAVKTFDGDFEGSYLIWTCTCGFIETAPHPPYESAETAALDALTAHVLTLQPSTSTHERSKHLVLIYEATTGDTQISWRCLCGHVGTIDRVQYPGSLCLQLQHAFTLHTKDVQSRTSPNGFVFASLDTKEKFMPTNAEPITVARLAAEQANNGSIRVLTLDDSEGVISELERSYPQINYTLTKTGANAPYSYTITLQVDVAEYLDISDNLKDLGTAIVSASDRATLRRILDSLDTLPDL